MIANGSVEQRRQTFNRAVVYRVELHRGHPLVKRLTLRLAACTLKKVGRHGVKGAIVEEVAVSKCESFARDDNVEQVGPELLTICLHAKVSLANEQVVIQVVGGLTSRRIRDDGGG